MSAPTTARGSTRRSERQTRRRRPPLVRLLGGTVGVWILVALASVAWWPVYRSPAMLVAGAAAVLVGSVVALAGAIWRLPAPAVATGTVVGFALVGVPVAVPEEAQGAVPTLHGFVSLLSSVALG